MADGWNIFLSYEHSDRARALKLVDAFEQEGWSVWWDHKIPPGKTWADVLERAIKDSECVVVLWSRTSITSEWVKKEARVAQNRKCLIPVRIDDIELPWEFEHVQAADLTDWNERRTDGFVNLIDAIQSILPMEPSEPIDGSDQGDDDNENEDRVAVRNQRKRRARTLLFPVHGVTLGTTTRSEIAWLGNRTKDAADHSYVVEGVTFKFDERSNIVDRLSLNRYSRLPEDWLELGFGWQKSYVEWLALLQGLGYRTVVTEKPHIEQFVGEESFSAKVVGRTQARHFEEIELHFDYQPGTTTSPDTLYSIDISVADKQGQGRDEETVDDALDKEDTDDSSLFEEDEEAETED